VEALTTGGASGQVAWRDVPMLTDSNDRSGHPTEGCLIDKAGALRCWGSIDEAAAPLAMPVAAPGGLRLLDRWAGPEAGCAAGPKGHVQCWRLPEAAEGPLEVFTVAGLPPKSILTVGRAYGRGCVLTEDGEVWCFRLDAMERPASRLAGLSPARALVMGGMGCVITDAGLSCFGLPGGTSWPGDDTRIRLGADEMGEPTAIESVGSVTSVSLSSGHVCVVDSAGAVKCWGENYAGQAVGRRLNSAAPLFVPLPGRARFLMVRETLSCAGLEDGRVFCWGSMRYGGTCRSVPTEVPSFSGAASVDASPSFALWGSACGRMPDGTLSCIRSHFDASVLRVLSVSAPLGPPLVEPLRSAALPGSPDVVGAARGYFWLTPERRVRGLESHDITGDWVALENVRRVMVLQSSLLAYDDSDAAWVGGIASDGGVPTGFPMVRAPALDGFTMVVRRWNRTCALDSARHVLCAETLWHKPDGQVDGGFLPFDVAGDVRSIALGGAAMVCVLRTSGMVECTPPEDPNDYAALPAGPLAPVSGLPPVSALAAGPFSGHLCALTRDGQVACWLSNEGDALGAGPGCMIGRPTLVELEARRPEFKRAR
jgi:hypothetical protein